MPSRWDTVSVDGEPMRCYVNIPDAVGPFPAVVVIQHAGGVDDFVRGMSDRLAGAHFAAIAPDLYHRDDPNSSDDPLTRMGRLRDVTIVADVNAAIEHTKGLPEVEADRIGITGYCMGGRVTYLMAAKNRNLKAAVVCWGGNIMVPWGEGPAPFDLSKDIDCPVLGLFGEEDPNPSPADVAKLDAELTNLSKTHEFHSYKGAGHAFMNEGRPSYRLEAAEDAWMKCVAWFDEHLRV
ncbi:MAG: dienelactone hydrolase family protein [Chloroflexi bacterium]|nr:MAG: dienelactone hydrolase family protein [Chloroflexota bacterium]TMG05988.1 MAG: dienelactone hydrolase family protein [Chloroflexota bacterium]